MAIDQPDGRWLVTVDSSRRGCGFERLERIANPIDLHLSEDQYPKHHLQSERPLVDHPDALMIAKFICGIWPQPPEPHATILPGQVADVDLLR